MKRNWLNTKIAKDFLHRKYFLKKELKTICLKSFFRNQNIKPIIRASVKLITEVKNSKRSKISIQQNRCLLTGKSKNTFKISGFTRQTSRKLIELGLLQNIQTESY